MRARSLHTWSGLGHLSLAASLPSLDLLPTPRGPPGMGKRTLQGCTNLRKYWDWWKQAMSQKELRMGRRLAFSQDVGKVESDTCIPRRKRARPESSHSRRCQACWQTRKPSLLALIINLDSAVGDYWTPNDRRRWVKAKPVLVALTGKACCCRMMGPVWWRFFSSSSRSLAFSASSTE